MPIDKNINIDLPVDAYDAEGNLRNKETESVSEESSTEASQAQEKVVEKTDEDNEQRVPYSRFAKIREERDRAEQAAEEARTLLRDLAQRRDEPQETTTASSYDEDYARQVKRLYGDTPVADEIINLNLKHQHDIEERAERRAVEAVSRMRDFETQVVSRNESVIDQRIEAFEDSLGRTMTEEEEAALLSITDEYTPKDSNGKYLGDILPFDKAWEVYELRKQQQATSSQTRRKAALEASSSRSQGEPTGEKQEADKSWNPLNWKSLHDRIDRMR